MSIQVKEEGIAESAGQDRVARPFMQVFRGRDLPTVRHLIQATLALYLIFKGWQFYQFVRFFETRGSDPFVPRPSVVEAFLPLSALVGLKNLIANGIWDPVHPAALAILISIVLVSFLFRKSFCGWLCPIGALSEALSKVGRWSLGRNFNLPRYIDLPLMGIKYLILVFFVKAILIDMNGAEAALFLQSPYNKIVDVKLLYFFTNMGGGLLFFLATMFIFSTLVANVWCRYLCPYGALLGLWGIISPLQIFRSAKKCTGCRRCSQACLHRIDVAKAQRVWSPECTSCLNCVQACRTEGALRIRFLPISLPLESWVVPVLVIFSFFLFIVGAQITGRWNTIISQQEYQRLIPQISYFGQ